MDIYLRATIKPTMPRVQHPFQKISMPSLLWVSSNCLSFKHIEGSLQSLLSGARKNDPAKITLCTTVFHVSCVPWKHGNLWGAAPFQLAPPTYRILTFTAQWHIARTPPSISLTTWSRSHSPHSTCSCTHWENAWRISHIH